MSATTRPTAPAGDPPPGAPQVLTLAEAATAPVGLVGGKAHNLGRLVAAGLAVPEGLVLTTAAFAGVPGPDLPEGAEGPGAASGPPAPPGLPAAAGALATVAEHFGDTPLAVRSSGTLEDAPTSSHAGQYRTVLDVRGASALGEAVGRCLDSAHGAAMAVLVQRLVPADVSGVAFTADPVTGSRADVVVAAVAGLGAALVAGGVTGDEWRVRDGLARPRAAGQGVLTAQQAQTVAALALRVQRLLGCPQDVEWAMTEHRLVLLQARPVTALPRPPAREVPPGSWVKDAERHPEPLHAFAAEQLLAQVAAGLTAVFREYGALADRTQMISIGGEPYMSVIPAGGERTGPPPPWWLLGLLARVHPDLRARTRRTARQLRPGALEAITRHWHRVDRPALQQAHAKFAAVDPDTLDDPGLAGHLGAVIGFTDRALRLHFRLIPAEIVPLFDLRELCHRRLGWDDPQVLELVAGASTTTTRAGAELAELAVRVRASPAALTALRRAREAGTDPVEAFDVLDTGLARDLAAWLGEYGQRCLSNDPATPTLAEQPALLGSLLESTLPDRDAEPGADLAASRARAELGRRDRARFEEMLPAARTAYALREDSAFWTASMPAGLVRRAMVRAGHRLTERGLLDRPGDVAHVEADLVRRALASGFGSEPDLRTRVIDNRAAREWVLAHPGPAVLGPAPSPPPDTRGLPRAARRLDAAMAWSRGLRGRVRGPAQAGAAVVTGIPGCAGRHTGSVRLVSGPADFPRLRPGDVLVCRTTDPAWAVLFGVAGALVTDHGGVLCHAAIVAREHGLPAVIGTGWATATLREGEVVTVDGSTGEVLRPAHDRNAVGPGAAGSPTRGSGSAGGGTGGPGGTAPR